MLHFVYLDFYFHLAWVPNKRGLIWVFVYPQRRYANARSIHGLELQASVPQKQYRAYPVNLADEDGNRHSPAPSIFVELESLDSSRCYESCSYYGIFDLG